MTDPTFNPIYGLGRIEAPDFRDQHYPVRSVLAALEKPVKLAERSTRYWWANGWWGDQGSTPHCVAFAWVHWLEDGPTTHAPKQAGAPTLYNTTEIYNDAQKQDEWPGENYAGTSVRAGAKVLQQLGVISEYRWAFDLQTALSALLNLGPIVVGSNWYESMFSPDKEGFLHIAGAVAGGHAYCVDGMNTRYEYVRIKNNWGRGWGRKGFAYLDFADLERLIQEQGEVCIASEIGD